MLIKERLESLIDIKQIYLEPAAKLYPRAIEILHKYPDAEITEVPSHWNIPALNGNEGSIEDWIKIKKNILILGIKKSLSCRANTRSSNFVAPSLANGCTMACSYCYVPRRKGFANPITVFVNIEQILKYLKGHASRQGAKTINDQIDPYFWVYDIGENNDCSVDALVNKNIEDMIHLFSELPNAKATFATKYVNPQMLSFNPRLKTRIRFSLMPANISKLIDIRTTPISERIDAINDFVEAGYEVHLNFSPVIYYENWLKDYRELLSEIDDKLNQKSKAQLKCEVIFLTHNTMLHEINMGWHPKGESVLWKPEIQETKFSQTGGKNLRYKRNLKSKWVEEFTDLLNECLPYCEVRYAF
jgi:spore photoproduct lyase family protein